MMVTTTTIIQYFFKNRRYTWKKVATIRRFDEKIKDRTHFLENVYLVDQSFIINQKSFFWTSSLSKYCSILRRKINNYLSLENVLNVFSLKSPSNIIKWIKTIWYWGYDKFYSVTPRVVDPVRFYPDPTFEKKKRILIWPSRKPGSGPNTRKKPNPDLT